MYLFANYKMYLGFAETNILVSQLLQSETIQGSHLDIALFPSALAFSEVEKALRDTNIAVGMQHVHHIPTGAYTGEVSAIQAAEAGAAYVLVGHSERRHIFGESDTAVKAQLYAALDAGLTPVLCVGETTDDLNANKVEYRIKKQLSILDGVNPEASFMIAYEPVWAISGSGTGQACDPKETELMHTAIRREVATYTAQTVPILYGGSVNSENVVSYTSLPSVDGILVGHAGTSYDSCLALVEALS